ncbi:hypothetical protein [Lacipirellula parvula]|uniref:DNA polymerase IV n=1 Tax=Lacipirellula parvula TaxID=2650471 RepID=A0A5K7XHY6_9BACT|nr:hypothetical protein [Lacipirellula parvula]BBO36015.1 DNA polymerase IV [Lacipirellula parvula]
MLRRHLSRVANPLADDVQGILFHQVRFSRRLEILEQSPPRFYPGRPRNLSQSSSRDAVKLCPDAVYVKRDFRWYEALSRRMLDLVKKISPRVEFYSIDESFCEVTEVAPRGLQATIMQRVSVRIGTSVRSS